jgi:hypothetical protein
MQAGHLTVCVIIAADVPSVCTPAHVQALSTLVEHSGADVRTAINTLQLLARQHSPARSISTQAPGSSSSTQPGSGQRRAQRVRITSGDIAASGAFGVKDVSHTPLGVVQDLLASNSSRAMAARLQQLAAAMKLEQRGGPGRHGRRSSRGAVAPASLSASAAARLVLQEHYNTLLDLGEHEQVSWFDQLASSFSLWYTS